MKRHQLAGMGSSSKPVKTGTWSPDEDNRLREAVAQHGNSWVAVAAKVGTRTGDQCAKRWNENLNPDLDHSPWSPYEDRLLLHLVGTFGTNWKSIADNFFEGRAPLALKNRHSLLIRRMKRQRGGAKQLSSSSVSGSGGTTAVSSPLPSSAAFGNPFDLATASTGLTTPPMFSTEEGEPMSAVSLSGQQSLNGSAEGDRRRLTTNTRNVSPVDDVMMNQYMVATTEAGNPKTVMVLSDAPSNNPLDAAAAAAAAAAEAQGGGGGDLGAWQSFLNSAHPSSSSLSSHHTTTTTTNTGDGFHHPSASSTSSSDMLLDTCSSSAFDSRSTTAVSISPPLHHSGEMLLDHHHHTMQAVPRGGHGILHADHSGGGGGGNGNGNGIDLVLTCQRGNLRTVAHHLVDAAMTEIKRPAGEEEQVTLTLRLRVGPG